MTHKRKEKTPTKHRPKSSALVLSEGDRTVLAGLADDQFAGLTAAEAPAALRHARSLAEGRVPGETRHAAAWGALAPRVCYSTRGLCSCVAFTKSSATDSANPGAT